MQALDEAVADLDTLQSNDVYRRWKVLSTVLDRIYRLDEALERQHGHPYTQARDADPGGQAVRGLVFIRGLSVHAQAELERLLWDAADMKVRVDGQWKSTRRVVRDGDTWKPAPVKVARLAWPERANLPGRANAKDKAGACYVAQVEGKPLREPAADARAFVASWSQGKTS